MKTRVRPSNSTPAPSPWISKGLDDLPAPPGPRERFPFDQLVQIRKLSILPYLRSLVRAHGDLVRINFSRVWVYLVSHPDDIREVLQSQHRRFVKGFAADLVRDALGYSVFAADGELHRRQQKLMQPAFRSDALERYAAMMVDCLRACDERWADGARLDVVEEMHRLTMSIATRTLFNMVPSKKQEQVSEALTTMIRGISERIATPMGVLKATFPVLPDRRWRESLRILDKMIAEIIQEHESGRLANDDLLGQLMAATDEAGNHLTNEQLRDEILTLFVAGHETTAVGLTWSWYEVARDQVIQTRLQEEVDQVCGVREPCYADLPKLRYCRKVFQESMRHYPPVPVLLRQALEDVELRGYRVPKGSVFSISPYVVHHDPRFFPNPEKFDPDRWTDAFEAQLHKFAYFPFGGGPRVCIGERFAWCEGTLAIAHFAQQWNFELLPYQDIRPGAMGTMRPEGAVEMIVRRRERQPRPEQTCATTPEPLFHEEKCPFMG